MKKRTFTQLRHIKGAKEYIGNVKVQYAIREINRPGTDYGVLISPCSTVY
jgi:hypothetical protein